MLIIRTAFLLCVAWLGLTGAAVCAQEARPALPFAGTDAVTLLNDGGVEERLGGAIEQIVGERLTFRRNGRGNILVLRLADVVEISFHRSLAWDEGLQQYREGRYQQALQKFDTALVKERRDWAWCELQAAAVRADIQLGRRQAAVDRIELILEKDPRSRHVSLLPLVWDARLPTAERISAEPDGLRGATMVKRLVAASALLHDPDYRGAATSVLERIREAEGLSRLGELATTQLWRLHLLNKPDERNPVLGIWADRVREMSDEARAGPQYVVARGYRQHHDYDRAAMGFLWMPLMSPLDRSLSAMSLVEAVECLKLAGRLSEAAVMANELQQRFPNTSAAEQLQQAGAGSAPERP
ncbi:MAG: hypothetical protein RIK87_27435 [Fuerstiella sp.]